MTISRRVCGGRSFHLLMIIYVSCYAVHWLVAYRSLSYQDRFVHAVCATADVRGVRGMPLSPEDKVTLNRYMDAYDTVGELIGPLVDNNAVATPERMAAIKAAMDELEASRRAHFDGIMLCGTRPAAACTTLFEHALSVFLPVCDKESQSLSSGSRYLAAS